MKRLTAPRIGVSPGRVYLLKDAAAVPTFLVGSLALKRQVIILCVSYTLSTRSRSCLDTKAAQRQLGSLGKLVYWYLQASCDMRDQAQSS